MPGHPEHVLYVWFDALANYLSGAQPFGFVEREREGGREGEREGGREGGGVLYVWFDALANYLSGLSLPKPQSRPAILPQHPLSTLIR